MPERCCAENSDNVVLELWEIASPDGRRATKGSAIGMGLVACTAQTVNLFSHLIREIQMLFRGEVRIILRVCWLFRKVLYLIVF